MRRRASSAIERPDQKGDEAGEEDESLGPGDPAFSGREHGGEHDGEGDHDRVVEVKKMELDVERPDHGGDAEDQAQVEHVGADHVAESEVRLFLARRAFGPKAPLCLSGRGLFFSGQSVLRGC